MCVAVPARVINIEEPWAEVDLEGTTFKINMTLTPEVKVGDYVLIHAGFSIQHLDPEEARETLRLWEEYYAAIENE
ncbi:MAG: hydrogenase expression/formation protein HypC [Clostridia bacterium]|jgi:hydrogenase expression/formation protein HypC|nr:hydrogenase expression/formation protein HypC [Clostridia bacterium]MDN5322647.1 hydrogenase expression/formation protein HypC [Clostridia bacterium]